MQCKCDKKMKFLFAWEDGQGTDYAFNLYACRSCGMILMHSVGKVKVKRWLTPSSQFRYECQDCGKLKKTPKPRCSRCAGLKTGRILKDRWAKGVYTDSNRSLKRRKR